MIFLLVGNLTDFRLISAPGIGPILIGAAWLSIYRCVRIRPWGSGPNPFGGVCIWCSIFPR